MSTFATTHCGLGSATGGRYSFGSKRHQASDGTEFLMRTYKAVVPVLGCPAMTTLNGRSLLKVSVVRTVTTHGRCHCRSHLTSDTASPRT